MSARRKKVLRRREKLMRSGKGWFAWYSEKQAELAGTVVYEKPDGQQIVCSEVRSTKTRCNWEDAKCVGFVTRFVRREALGAMMMAIPHYGGGIKIPRSYATALTLC